MAAPIVSTLPAAPLPTDSRTQFNNKAYNFVGALVRFSTEINTLAEWINAVSGGISELGVIASSVSDTGGFSNAAVVASRGVRSASAYTLSMGYSASADSPSTANITIELDALIGQVKAKTISMGGTYVTVDNFLNAQMASHGWIGTPGASTANNTLISSTFSDLQGSANVLHASPYAKIEGSNNGLIRSPNARATGTNNLLLNSTGSNVTGHRNTLLSAATQLFTADDCLIYGNSGVTFSGDVSNVISLNTSGLSVSNSSYVTAIQAPSTTFADTTGSVVLATPGSVTLNDSDYSFVAASVAVNMSSSTRSAVIGSAAVTFEDHDQTVVLASQNVKPRKSNSVVLGYGIGPASTDNITIELDAETGRIDAKSVYINGVEVTPGGGGGAGTVTSVGLSVPTGLTVANSPVTSSGTLAVSFASGYSIPTTAKQAEWDNKLDASAVGVTVASLVGGVVPSNQLPSYVDDVLEYANLAAFPATGETGKIYIAIDTNSQYRWSGSAYVQIVASPGTTDNVPEGSTNQYFTQARVRSTPLTGFAAAAGFNAVLATDTLLQAFNKVQGWLNGIGTIDVSGSNNSVVKRTATGGVTASGAGGFISETFNNNERNPIWRFGNASGYGISYYTGTSGYGGSDSIGFHFGTSTADATSSVVNISESGIAILTDNGATPAYFESQITVRSGGTNPAAIGLWRDGLTAAQIVHRDANTIEVFGATFGTHGNLIARDITSNGGVFTGNGSGLTNLNAAKKTSVVAISTASHNLDTVNESAYHRFTFSGAKTVTVRPNSTHALATDGAWVFRNQSASGNLTVTPGAGVTINAPYGGTLVLAPGMTCTLQKVGTDTYDLIGQTVAI